MVDRTALIVGVGDGLSRSLSELLHGNNYQLALAARNIEKLSTWANALDASTHSCDATRPDDVSRVFAALDTPVRVVVCNPSARVVGSVVDFDPKEVEDAIAVTAFASFLVAQQAAKHMLVSRHHLIDWCVCRGKRVSQISAVRDGEVCAKRFGSVDVP